ncbi:MAG: helix-turn-helix domain-containing protein [Dehalococcoidia bacterium]
MPIEISGENYYRTSEAAQLAGISRSTLLRWIDQGIIRDESRRDRRGWRLFTEADIKQIENEANHVKQPTRLIP